MTQTQRPVQDAVLALANFVAARDAQSANYALGYLSGVLAQYMADKGISEDFTAYVTEYQAMLKRNA